jgi:hypothetical protein
MKGINIGIVNLIVSKKLKDAYFSNALIEESKLLTNDFFTVVRNSPILQLEFKVFNNIENKHIENDLAATRYIDNNIKLFEVYTLNEIDAEHEKLKPFITEEAIVDDSKIKLYIAISNLIRESLSDYDSVDVDSIHESFTEVLNHVKTTKKSLMESVEAESINEDVIEIAIDKFNDRYETMNEDDRILLQKLITSNETQKAELLEEFKATDITLLENVQDSSPAARNKVENALKKIREMKFNIKSVDDDIIGLHELKKNLL